MLIVDDEPIILATLTAFLRQDFDILTANSAEAAQQVFAQRNVDLVLADQRMPGMSGVQLLEWIRECSPKTIRLLMTGPRQALCWCARSYRQSAGGRTCCKP
jgi:two-component system response regulator HupR/HoxA